MQEKRNKNARARRARPFRTRPIKNSPNKTAPEKTQLLLFNKPWGVLSQFSGETENLSQHIKIPGIYPAGRLDKDSEGLLLLTNNGQLQAQISSPKHKLSKTYYVLVEGCPDLNALQALRTGLNLKDGPTLPAEAELVAEPSWLWTRNPPVRFRKTITDHWLKISIREGRNRQVRRMTAAVGHPTLRLIRHAIGPLSIDGLALGQQRSCTEAELQLLSPKSISQR